MGTKIYTRFLQGFKIQFQGCFTYIPAVEFQLRVSIMCLAGIEKKIKIMP